MFGFGMRNKTIKELRKNQCFTVSELAQLVKVDLVDILKIDDWKLKDVPQPLNARLTTFLRGDGMDKMPWL